MFDMVSETIELLLSNKLKDLRISFLSESSIRFENDFLLLNFLLDLMLELFVDMVDVLLISVSL